MPVDVDRRDRPAIEVPLEAAADFDRRGTVDELPGRASPQFEARQDPGCPLGGQRALSTRRSDLGAEHNRVALLVEAGPGREGKLWIHDSDRSGGLAEP